MVKGRQLWGVAVWCVLSGSGWVLTQGWPSTVEWPFAACLHFGLVAFVGLAFAAFRGRLTGWPGRRVLALSGAGVCFLAVPASAVQFAAGKVSEATIAALFCAVPLLTLLAADVLGHGEPRTRGFMVPALTGLAGAALLFPFGVPGTLRRWLFTAMIAGVCVMVAGASVVMHRLMQNVEIGAAVAGVAFGSATLLGLFGISAGWPAAGIRIIAEEVLRGAVLDLPEVWLLVWLIREVEPARLSARFLLVPLATVLEGYAIEHDGIGWQALLAMALLGAGGVMLLLRDEPEETPGLQLR